jgi:predicted RNA-binding protein YlqC (UPF0109 family)
MSTAELNGASGHEAADEDVMAAAMESDFEVDPDDARLIELVGYLVQGVVAHPEEVEVEEFLDDLGSVYGVRVHPEDVGRVIGKEGRVANALRHLVKAAATKTGARVTVEIITDDSPIALADSDELQQGEMPSGGEAASDSDGENNEGSADS